MAKKYEISAVLGALVVILLGVGAFLYVQSFEAAPTPSVEGKERVNEEPAGPADPSALPGNREE
jgi:hypothetical protein